MTARQISLRRYRSALQRHMVDSRDMHEQQGHPPPPLLGISPRTHPRRHEDEHGSRRKLCQNQLRLPQQETRRGESIPRIASRPILNLDVQMVAFIQSQPDVIDRIIRLIETPAFVDLLVRIIQLDEPDGCDNILEVRRASPTYMAPRLRHSPVALA